MRTCNECQFLYNGKCGAMSMIPIEDSNIANRCFDFSPAHSIETSEPDEPAQRIAELEQVASNNADWFNQLVHDLAAIYKCEKKPSAVIQAAKDREQQLATAVELLERVQTIAWLADREHRTEQEIATFLATVRGDKKGQP